MLYYEGVVTSVNEDLWTITLDNTIIVHLVYLAVTNRFVGFPELDSTIHINYYHIRGNEIFLCEQGRIKPKTRRKKGTNTTLLEIVDRYKIGYKDLIEAYKNYNVITENFKHYEDVCVFYELLENLAKNVKLNDHFHEDVCDNIRFHRFKFKSVFPLKNVDSSMVTSSKGPAWHFGTESKIEREDILIGTLYINSSYGIPFLSDKNHRIACIITNIPPIELTKFINKLIMIKNYRAFSEIYREEDATNLEYLMFDFSDMYILNSKVICDYNSLLIEEEPLGYDGYKFQFQIIKKATPNFAAGKRENWMEVEMEGRSSYLCLDKNYFKVLPYLVVGKSYICYHQEPLCNLQWIEVQRVKELVDSYKLNGNSAVFRCVDECDFKEDILSVEEAYEFLKTSCGLVSFDGTIKYKKLQDGGSSSRTFTTERAKGFGTSGTKTHVICVRNEEDTIHVQVFLNNWENLRVPLGLIPEMKIRIRNVLTQKHNYYKSCAFTSFEPICYRPQVFFDTVNLITPEQYAYSHFGYGDLIPAGVLMRGKVIKMCVKSTKIHYKCDECLKTFEDENDLCECIDSTKQLITSQTIKGWDERGTFLIINNNLDLLKYVLGLDSYQWEQFVKSFQVIRRYCFGETADEDFSNEETLFHEAITLNIKIFNLTQICDCTLICRKFDYNPNDNDGIPLWYCVDVETD